MGLAAPTHTAPQDAAGDELTGFALLAHVMGMAARSRGETALENPFGEEPGCASAWLDGWMRNGAGQVAALAF